MKAGQLALLLLSFYSFSANARTDYFGREISATSRLKAHVLSPEAARFGPDLGTANFLMLPFEARAVTGEADAVAIGDVNGDGRADVSMTADYANDPNGDHLLVFLQGVTGALQGPQTFALGQSGGRSGIAVADLDGANGLDVAAGSGAGVTVFHATPTPGLLTRRAIITVQDSMAVVALGMHGNGHNDLVSVSWNNGGNLYSNTGAGAFFVVPWATPVVGSNGLATGDLDGDGVRDLAVMSGQGPPPNVMLYRNNGNGVLTQIGTLSGNCPDSTGAHGIGIGDVNHDGLNDVVVSGGGNNPWACMEIYYGKGGGQFAAAQFKSTVDCPETLQVADINLDGRDDIIVVHGGWMAVGVYLQQADGTLGQEAIFSLPYASFSPSQGLAVGDFSGDGYPDIAIGDYNHGLVTLINASRLFADDFD